MNCQEVLNLLYDIIDREASEIDVKEVQEHLKHCKDCFGVYKVEGALQHFISEKIKSRNEPSPKLESLRMKIVEQLDQIDCEINPDGAGDGASESRRPPFLGFTKILAAAAAIVIIIGAGFLISGYFHHDEFYIPLERAHWNAGENLIPYKNIQHLYSALSHTTKDMNYKINQDVNNYQLIGGQQEEIMQANMTHFVYADKADRTESRLVSVFVVPAEQFILDEELKKHQVTINDIVFYDHNCRGCRLVFHRVGDLIVITATTEKSVNLLEFIPGQQAI
ncbi:MAG: zf-HC2 domain-containing protein [candidate division Zixibacteria bacterium]|nr:zf-HC2 domain-containing protein [candidate division Zixibacteria bacterium]